MLESFINNMARKIRGRSYERAFRAEKAKNGQENEVDERPIDEQWGSFFEQAGKKDPSVINGEVMELWKRHLQQPTESQIDAFCKINDYYQQLLENKNANEYFNDPKNLMMVDYMSSVTFKMVPKNAWLYSMQSLIEKAEEKNIDKGDCFKASKVKTYLSNLKIKPDFFKESFSESFAENNVEMAAWILNDMESVLHCLSAKSKSEVEKFLKTSNDFFNVCGQKSDNYLIQKMIESTRNIFAEYPDLIKYHKRGENILDFESFARSLDFKELSKLQNSGKLEKLSKELFSKAKMERKFVEKYDDKETFSGFVSMAILENKKNAKSGILRRDFETHEKDFQMFSNKELRDYIKADLGIDFEIIKDESQRQKACLYVIEFLKRIKIDEVENYKKFFSAGDENEKINRLKTFFSLEIENENADRIVEIGSAKENQIVFQKICEIIDITEKETRELEDTFFKDNSKVDFSKVRLELLKKVHKIVDNYAENNSEKNEAAKRLKDLEKSLTEIILLSSVFKSAKTQGVEIKWENIKDFNLDIKDFESGLNEGDKKEMLTVAERNWRQNEKLKDVVMGGLGESLENSQHQKWYVCKFQGKIVSFVRFEETNHGTLYAGSFNVDPEARGVGVGEEMMNRALIEEGKKNILEATASPRNVVGTCYVEKVGFVLDGYIADYHKTGEPLFSMQLDNAKNKSYAYRNEGRENSISEEQIKKQCWTQENLDQIVGAETIVLKFDMKNEFEKMNSAMQKLLVAKNDEGKNIEGQNLENRYVVTRYFQDDKDNKENHVRYFVLEKIK